MPLELGFGSSQLLLGWSVGDQLIDQLDDFVGFFHKQRRRDVALRVRRPMDADLFGRRLTGIAWAFYGPRNGAAALRRDGRTFNFARHTVIGWDEPARIVAADWVGANVPPERIGLRANSLVHQLRAVSAGLGIALLPCYLGDGEAGVRRAMEIYERLDRFVIGQDAAKRAVAIAIRRPRSTTAPTSTR